MIDWRSNCFDFFFLSFNFYYFWVINQLGYFIIIRECIERNFIWKSNYQMWYVQFNRYFESYWNSLKSCHFADKYLHSLGITTNCLVKQKSHQSNCVIAFVFHEAKSINDVQKPNKTKNNERIFFFLLKITEKISVNNHLDLCISKMYLKIILKNRDLNVRISILLQDAKKKIIFKHLFCMQTLVTRMETSAHTMQSIDARNEQ